VKPKSLSFIDFVDETLEKQNYSISKIPIGLLPTILNKTRHKVLVFCSNDSVKSLSLSFEKKIGHSVACISEDPIKTPDSFIGFYKNLYTTSLNFLNSSPESIKICIFDTGLVNKSLFGKKQADQAEINRQTNYESIIKKLNDFKYTPEDFLENKDSSFLIKGGIIDIRPFGSLDVYRVSFLQNHTCVYLLDRDGFIVKTVDSLTIKSSRTVLKKTISNYLPKEFLTLKYVDGVLNQEKKSKGKTKKINIKQFDFQWFSKNKKNYLSCSLLKDAGYIIQNNYKLVPSWFEKGPKTAVLKKPIEEGLVVGYYYTHIDFGICQFTGLEETLNNKERLCLQFADGLIKIDVSFINKIFFYSSSLDGGTLSLLSKKSSWKGLKKKTEAAALNYAEDLVVCYKERRNLTRPPYLVVGKILSDFVNSFKHQDTLDQEKSWNDILNDLKSSTPMNRLLCGDVGFGKTEIAIRATFVASLSSKQTIVLAPTTVLASQLFSCFNNRLSFFGVFVDRFYRNSSKTNTLDSFLNKRTDVLICTHAILRKPEILKQCSLFIVDEEHRFGVKDKELIFKYRPNVDYLSLSATPIPRTLQMSLSNIRSASVIKTPPVSRKPIISQLCYYNFELIENLIVNEINRGGQVYFVDNSVDNVTFYLNKFSSLYPNINFDMIFGAQGPKKNDVVMKNFKLKHTQVLFTTTIIESGVDIGSVNTIIINNSYMFGLSQLYQLRGRVGRSNIQAYCYFLIPKKYNLTLNAKKRLKAILKYNKLGSGYNLALSDLDTRGFGSFFGYGQSGTTGVGYELYTKIIGDQLSKVLNKHPLSTSLVEISQGYIPKSFIENDGTRAQIYKEIFSASRPSHLKDVENRVSGLFGFCDKNVKNLIADKLLSFDAAKVGLVSVLKKDFGCVFVFDSDFYKTNINFLLSSVEVFCKKSSIIYVFKSNKNLLNLECFVEQKNVKLFCFSLIKNLLQ
tara:strand:- start:2883 stop:5768 length:2886 start_codon:yes stop_codon:yes gene_type:complete